MGEEVNPTELRARQRVGQLLRNKWRLDRLVGVGGMAAVYAATHRNGMRGAVKMLHLELCAHEGLRKRFLREGYAANTVDHPGAVSVLDDDVTEDGSVFLVMELLDGQSLEAVVADRPSRTLEAAEVLAVGDALADVLAAAHAKGIVHRDLKPENLFVTRRGELKVLDFGIARLMDQSDGGTGTKTGTALGTPAYMPPEQALGNVDQIDARTDLWAAGATLFSLLTGRPVHSGPTLSQVLLAAMTKPAPSLAEVAPHAPAGLVEVVDRALQVAREERWQSAGAMQQAIRTVRAQHPGELPRPRVGPTDAAAPTVATPVPTGDRRSTGATEYSAPAALTPPTAHAPRPGAVFTSPATGTTASAAYGAGPPPGTTSGLAVADVPRASNRGLLIGLVGGAVAIALGLGAVLVMRSPSTGAHDSNQGSGPSVAVEPTAAASESATASPPSTAETTAAGAATTEPSTLAGLDSDAGAPPTPTATAPLGTSPPPQSAGTPRQASAAAPPTRPKATATTKPSNPLDKW